jgi:hypothetical protein
MEFKTLGKIHSTTPYNKARWMKYLAKKYEDDLRHYKDIPLLEGEGYLKPIL